MGVVVEPPPVLTDVGEIALVVGDALVGGGGAVERAEAVSDSDEPDPATPVPEPQPVVVSVSPTAASTASTR